jgi:hypothetical protein
MPNVLSLLLDLVGKNSYFIGAIPKVNRHLLLEETLKLS